MTATIRTVRTRSDKGCSRPTTRNKKKELEKESREWKLVEDMDTDDLIEESSHVLSTKNTSIFDQSEMETDDLLDEVTISALSKKKKKKKKAKGKGKDIQEGTTNTDTSSDTDKGKKKITASPITRTKKIAKKEGYDKKRTSELTKKYPDKYWQFHADTKYYMIDPINDANQLESVPCSITDHDAITSMTLSENGLLLATYSIIGSIKIWHIEEKIELLRKLRDRDERNIDEFFCGSFINDAPELLITGGKLKDRYKWSEENEDNPVIPCPLKIFDMVTGKVVAELHGHKKEIHSVKSVKFNGENYYISTSEDGQIIKWKMADDWVSLIESNKMDDDLSTATFTVSFLPNTGNKYFMATCDEHLRLYDFENNKLLQSFENIYSSICDCGKFIKWLDEYYYWKGNKKRKYDQQYAWFISRGTELCDASNGVSTKQNTCTLHKLIYPKTDGGEFALEEVRRFKHDEYESNSWFVKITSNGRYILAPTIHGQYFVFNLVTGQTTGIIKAHQDVEVRDVIFHPYRPLIFSCSDDGNVKAYTYKSENTNSDKTNVNKQKSN